jgi:predicted transcriptional regulator of viral defense system
VTQLSQTVLNLDDTPPLRDALIAAVAARQHGQITAKQLARAGVGKGSIAHRVKTGRLHRRHHGVYSVGHARVSQEGAWMAAILAAGDGAALSHLSATQLLKVWLRKVDGIDVIAPQRRQVKGVRVHTCRHLDPRDMTVVNGIPVTTVARTLVDLTDALTAEQIANVIHEAAFRGKFSEPATRTAMDRARGRDLNALERALALNANGSAGTRSDLEDEFLKLIRAANLPDPLLNAAVQTRHKPIEVDFRWGNLCVELDGPGHRRPRTQEADRQRDEALTQAGYRNTRVTPPPRPHPAADPRPP